MNEMRRRAFGILLIIAAAGTVAFGYGNAPDANTCSTDNNLDRALGMPATCSTTPSAMYFVACAILLIAGLLIIIPWWRRLAAER
jgi:hypothetical protein